MKITRFLSALLAFIMLLCVLTGSSFAAQEADAADSQTPQADVLSEQEEDTSSTQTAAGTQLSTSWLNADGTINYTAYEYYTAEEKMADMQKVLESDDGRYALYIEPVSGEIAYYDNQTQQALFSNPYFLNDQEGGMPERAPKDLLLSQISLQFSQNGGKTIYNSYSWCIARDQLQIKKIANGIRVEYAIGRIEARRLMPYLIEKSSYETNILAELEKNCPSKGTESFSFLSKKFNGAYTLKDPSDPSLTTRLLKQMYSDFKITQKMAVYVFNPTATESEKDRIEEAIRKYCPNYTFEKLEADHDLTEYTGTEKAPPLFRISLEYYLEDDSLKVRMPAKDMRYVEADYALTYLRVLPYFGSGKVKESGAMFIPDGSGALIDYQDFSNEAQRVITQKIYGQDYAYYTLEGEHQEVVRMPVYGNYRTTEQIGYLAVIESGAELAEITSETGGKTVGVNTVYTSLYPRANDSYDISESISAAASAMVSVTSNKKYTGDYVLRFFMLNGEDKAKSAGLSDSEYYTADLNGMVAVYRDYLTERGVLTRLTKEDVQKDIPLYIESFGTVDTETTVLTFPVTVQTPLTTFDDLRSMYEALAEKGITNVNFRLTGFFNGGMKAEIPYKVKTQKAVGGNDGFRSFMEYAAEKNIGVFPDFDFVFVPSDAATIASGLNKRSDLAKAGDDRYASKRVYSPLYQTYEKVDYLLLSPCCYDKFYEKFSKNYAKLNPTAISVATLGSYLNSDFDKEETDLRDATLLYTEQLFANLENDYDRVLTDGGNAYALPYVTDLLNVPLDNSNFNNASYSVPFIGMVLHGSVNFAGSALNTVGDIDYALLRAIENGASAYFTLSYRNVEEMKKSEELSKYYSVSFDIWYNDLYDAYNTLNDAIGDLQDKLILQHSFLAGKRHYEAEEAAAIEAERQAIMEKYEGVYQIAELQKLEARSAVENGRIVKVVYEGGTTFYLNFNSFAIEVTDGGQTYTLDGFEFIRVNAREG